MQLPFIQERIVCANKHKEISKPLSRSSNRSSCVGMVKVQSEADLCCFIGFGAA